MKPVARRCQDSLRLANSSARQRPVVLSRDMAHARIKAMLDAGEPMPEYLKNHPVYYAGPAKTPQGMP